MPFVHVDEMKETRVTFIFKFGDSRDTVESSPDIYTHILNVLPLFVQHRRTNIIGYQLSFIEQVLNDEQRS